MNNTRKKREEILINKILNNQNITVYLKIYIYNQKKIVNSVIYIFSLRVTLL